METKLMNCYFYSSHLEILVVVITSSSFEALNVKDLFLINLNYYYSDYFIIITSTFTKLKLSILLLNFIIIKIFNDFLK